jgi:hypothetical protein
MTSGRIEGAESDVFQVRPEHAPKSKPETYKRLHYYVAKMGVTVSDQLQSALIDLRRNAHYLPDQSLQRLALKGYSDEEFVSAVKEIVCLWMHMEAMDQGGEDMPRWILTFLRLGFGATDYMLPRPKAMDVMMSYEHCDDYAALTLQSSVKIARILGFGNNSNTFAAAIGPVLLQTAPLRQQILEKALTLPIETILNQALI